MLPNCCISIYTSTGAFFCSFSFFLIHLDNFIEPPCSHLNGKVPRLNKRELTVVNERKDLFPDLFFMLGC